MSFSGYVGLAATVIALATAMLGALRYAAHTYARTLGSRKELASALSQIGPGVTTQHVEKLLGPPVYRREAITTDESGTYESIYFTRHAYVQIIHTEHEEVLAFGVTTFDPNFKVELPLVPPATESRRPVRLGTTTFSELEGEPFALWLHVGPYRAHYNEVFFYGRSGKYRSFGYARNEAGVGTWGIPGAAVPTGQLKIAEMRASPPEAYQEWLKFRERTTINTICVYSDKVSHEALNTFSFWRLGLDSEATPNLLTVEATLFSRLRNTLKRSS